jgi:hypothetical protein
MKQRLYWFSIVVAVLAALTLSAPAMAAGKPVPFKGRSSGVVTTVGIDPVAGVVYTHAEGQGQATHLGHFTQTGDTTVDLVTGNARGTWTLTAANSDMLFLEMTAYGIDPTHGVGTFTVVGGTGRFQGASGSYQQIIVFVSEPGATDTTFTDVLTGTIFFGHQ